MEQGWTLIRACSFSACVFTFQPLSIYVLFIVLQWVCFDLFCLHVDSSSQGELKSEGYDSIEFDPGDGKEVVIFDSWDCATNTFYLELCYFVFQVFSIQSLWCWKQWLRSRAWRRLDTIRHGSQNIESDSIAGDFLAEATKSWKPRFSLGQGESSKTLKAYNHEGRLFWI